MFSGKTYDCVGFNSVSEDAKTSINANVQTSEVVVKEEGAQSKEMCHKNMQTEAPPIQNEVKYDERKLLNFLNKVTGTVLKELDKAARTKAFTVQKSRAEDDLLKEEVKELYILSGQTLPEMSQARVSCLSWSCTGNVIAVGFESPSHEGWCTHESCVNFYNISSFKFDGKNVSHRIQTDSCVTSVAMHPYEPSIVALGTHSGNVEVWSVGKENKFDGVRMSNEQYHEDKVTQISWANDTSLQLILVSSSLDGKMCILRVSAGSCQLIDKYILDPESPDVLKPGVTCFSFCTHQPGTFVAGLESGQILLCSTFGINKNANSTVAVKSPVLRPLHKKTGPITYIKFNPNEEHVFLVTALDFKISVYNIEQDVPILDIHSDIDIIGADWYPEQKKTIIAWGVSPKLFIYNEDNGNIISELFPDDETTKNRKYHKALFNLKSPKLLALADSDSNSFIWSVPTQLKH